MYYYNKLYREDLINSVSNITHIEQLNGSNILITGASGMIGSFLVDALLYCNELLSCNINIYAMGRNKISLEKRFKSYSNNPFFHILEHDVTLPISYNVMFDYIIHAASNAYPQAFSTDPIGTIMANVWGVYNLLEYSKQKGIDRFLFISSGEVYGQGSNEIDGFDEVYSGYIDNLSVRSCYPNSKRTAETLCVSYMQQYNIDTIIARPCHTYGPTATLNDNRASSQFINDVINDNDIIMKTQGMQLRSYCYISDCVSGILTILINGKSGNAYNIANKESNITIRQLAETIASIAGKKVIYDLTNEADKLGYNPVTKSVLKADKLENLGWSAKYDIRRGINRTIEILKQTKKCYMRI